MSRMGDSDSKKIYAKVKLKGSRLRRNITEPVSPCETTIVLIVMGSSLFWRELSIRFDPANDPRIFETAQFKGKL